MSDSLSNPNFVFLASRHLHTIISFLWNQLSFFRYKQVYFLPCSGALIFRSLMWFFVYSFMSGFFPVGFVGRANSGEGAG